MYITPLKTRLIFNHFITFYIVYMISSLISAISLHEQKNTGGMLNKETHPDNYRDITDNQKKMWGKGDFNEIARQNMMMGEDLCRAIDPRPGQRVLDVACGSGTAALVAARRYCDVTGIDYVPELIDRARRRAEAGGLQARFEVADAQDLPFPDNSFDVVLSVYGVQFAPDQEKAASEMMRVIRPGGRIGLASPITEGWSGDFFATHGKYVPPPPGVKPPLRWGTEKGLDELLGDKAASIENEKRISVQYYLSPDHALDVFKTWFGPTLRAMELLDEEQQASLLGELKEVFNRYNRADDGTAVVENIYLMSRITK
jgi:SAM-dependent methyltransferase